MSPVRNKKSKIFADSGRISNGMNLALFLVFLAPSVALAQSAPPPRCTLTATPTTVQLGQSVRLEWHSVNAQTAYVSTVGSTVPNGSAYTTPSKSRMYGAAFAGPGGNTTCSATVYVVTTAGSQVGSPSESDFSFPAQNPSPTFNSPGSNPPPEFTSPNTNPTQMEFNSPPPNPAPSFKTVSPSDFAQPTPGSGSSFASGSGMTLKSLIEQILGILQALVSLFIGLALVLFLWGAVQFIYRADPGKAANRELLTWGLLAMFVMVSVWGILALLTQTFFGS